MQHTVPGVGLPLRTLQGHVQPASCPTTISPALYSRWQPWGLAKVSPVKPGLQRSQRSPCTCSLHTHWPVSGSQGAPGTAPSGSHSQAEKQKQCQSSEKVPGGSTPTPHSTAGFQPHDPSQAWNPLCLVPHLPPEEKKLLLGHKGRAQSRQSVLTQVKHHTLASVVIAS